MTITHFIDVELMPSTNQSNNTVECSPFGHELPDSPKSLLLNISNRCLVISTYTSHFAWDHIAKMYSTSVPDIYLN